MSKVAAYLQEHILGEVLTNASVLRAVSHDGSVLEMMPEILACPRVTNDIRKISRFAWQLAEKGHVLPLTPRGHGTDHTGGAIGEGVVISLPTHMNRVLEFDVKQKLVRAQPGVSIRTLSDALSLHGMGVPGLPSRGESGTLGGAVANNASGPLSGKYGDMGTWTHQLEVVLANGDVLQTERLSKRELNKKKGLQTFEGEIYRGIDNLIEDKKELIDSKLVDSIRDNVGYTSLAKVKRKDGSFDLTPLIVGSQGTLGIISEMILKCEFMSAHIAACSLSFRNKEAARDVLDHLTELEPAFAEYYSGDLLALAAARGKKYGLLEDGATPGAVILVGFDEFNERARRKKLKRVAKLLSGTDAVMEMGDGEDAEPLLALRDIAAFINAPDGKEMSAPPLIDGAYVPRERFEEFSNALELLATKYHVTLPLHSRVLENILYTRPILQLRKVGDKQKIFKLLDEYGTLVEAHGGHLIGENGEGRVKARFAYKQLDDDVLEVFATIKAIFDPQNILNPGVKQTAEVRQLVARLRDDYEITSL